MTQPPASGRGPAEEPARDFPGPGGGDGRDPRLAGFAESRGGDTCPPSAALAAVVEDLSGRAWRCEGATDDELIGLLGRWEALGSWTEAGKLGVVRELIRRRARPGLRGRLSMHGDLPDQCHDGMAHEVSNALGISIRSADTLITLAWDLQARLPGIGAALADGRLSAWKARLISDELAVLTDELAAQAEKLILDQLTAQTTPGELGKLAAQAVVTVDPDGAAERREHAERERARVAFWRDNGGACALAAYGLPTDAALTANDAIQTRALHYKKAKVRPDARMDQLRVLAFLDILNGITLDARVAQDRADVGDCPDAPGAGPGSTSGRGGEASTSHGERRGDRASHDGPGDHGNANPGDVSGDTDGNGGTRGHSGGNRGGCGGDPSAAEQASMMPSLTARANLTLPLATLLGLADRPGAAHGLGPLDPALVRDLAAAAAQSPHTEWCMTITDERGVAIGHGCARPARTGKAHRASPPPASRDGPRSWALTPRDDPGPAGGYGTWTLTLPGGRNLDIKLAPVPVTDCDHRHESAGYQPSDTLRHLVQVRDGTCTFPTCTRHARESDFEHAIPYDKGGRTCACNGAARSRRCHHVKQSDGWTVTQPQPGHHQWTTPSGRTYTQGPMKYPALRRDWCLGWRVRPGRTRGPAGCPHRTGCPGSRPGRRARRGYLISGMSASGASVMLMAECISRRGHRGGTMAGTPGVKDDTGNLRSRVADLVPDFQSRAGEAERLRAMPADLVQRARAAGLFRLNLPRSLGGYELDPAAAVEIFEEISRAGGSAGWTIAIG